MKAYEFIKENDRGKLEAFLFIIARTQQQAVKLAKRRGFSYTEAYPITEPETYFIIRDSQKITYKSIIDSLDSKIIAIVI